MSTFVSSSFLLPQPRTIHRHNTQCKRLPMCRPRTSLMECFRSCLFGSTLSISKVLNCVLYSKIGTTHIIVSRAALFLIVFSLLHDSFRMLNSFLVVANKAMYRIKTSVNYRWSQTLPNGVRKLRISAYSSAALSTFSYG